jgi:hypothetical protein
MVVAGLLPKKYIKKKQLESCRKSCCMTIWIPEGFSYSGTVQLLNTRCVSFTEMAISGQKKSDTFNI